MFRAFFVSLLTTQSPFTKQFLHSHRYAGGSDYLAGCHWLIRNINHSHTHTPMAKHQEQFGVQCFAQGHFNMLSAWDWTRNLPITVMTPLATAACLEHGLSGTWPVWSECGIRKFIQRWHTNTLSHLNLNYHWCTVYYVLLCYVFFMRLNNIAKFHPN